MQRWPIGFPLTFDATVSHIPVFADAADSRYCLQTFDSLAWLLFKPQENLGRERVPLDALARFRAGR
jgi:hypothetical protein